VAEFDELMSVSHHDSRRLLQAVDPQDLALALALQGAPEMMRKRARMGLSSPLKEQVAAHLDATIEASQELVAAAQQRIVELARRL
jgi:flagellar motor switch protein FliG